MGSGTDSQDFLKGLWLETITIAVGTYDVLPFVNVIAFIVLIRNRSPVNTRPELSKPPNPP